MSADEKRQLVELARAGKPAAFIARHLGRSVSAITRHAYLAGIELECGRRALSDAEVETVNELAALGFTCAAIAKQLERSEQTIGRYARRAGLDLRPPPRGRSTTIRWDEPEYVVLRQMAARRALSVAQFCRVLVAAVITGHLVDAVLDVSSPIA
jgi:hypothetical protein